MPADNLTLSSDKVLAEYVEIDQFRGFIQQRLGVGPDLMAMLIRDGQIAFAEHGANIAVGGFWSTLKEKIGGQHSLRLLLANMKPFPLTMMIGGLTSDNVKVAGELTFEVQINPERSANILGLLGAATIPLHTPASDVSSSSEEKVLRRVALTKEDILARLKPNLEDRVIAARVRAVAATELRGNTELQAKVQSDIMSVAQQLAGDLGLLIRSASLVWAFNEEEIAAIDARNKMRAREAADLDAQLLRNAIEREQQTTVFKINADHAVDLANVGTEAELRRRVLDNEISFVDARDTGRRMAELSELDHQFRMLQSERRDKLDAEMEAAEFATALTLKRAETEKAELENVAHSKLSTADLDIAIAGKQLELNKLLRENSLLQGRHDAVLRDIDRDQRSADLSLDRQHNALVRQQQLEDLKTTNEANLVLERGRAQIGIDVASAQSKTELDLVHAFGMLPKESVDIIVAGMKPEVAQVMIARAQQASNDAGQREALLREMIGMATAQTLATREMAESLADKSVAAVTGVAQGVGGVAQQASIASTAMVKCQNPACGFVFNAKLAQCPACETPRA